jgi:heavy metal sensor kinase
MIRLIPRSIRTRLAVYVLVLLAVLVLSLLASVYLLASSSIWRSFRDGLVAEAQSLAFMMEYEKVGSFDIEIPDSLLSRFDRAPGRECYRVLDVLGRTLARSRSLQSGSDLWQPTQNWITKARLDDAVFRKVRIGGEEKGLLTLKCLPRIEGGEQQGGHGEEQKEEDPERSSRLLAKKAAVIVQVTGSTASVRHLLGRLKTILFVGGFVTLALATLGSRAVARMGLRPVRSLASGVQVINEHNLGTRIPQDTLPDELVPLATKTNEMLSRLEEAFQREKRLTSDAAHEIRTPLSSLITTLEVALRKDRSPEEYQQMMSECLSSARHLKQLTDALLFLAGLDAGRVRAQPMPINIRELLDETIAIHKATAEKKSLAIRTNVSIVEATLEPDLLTPILNNLISNAVEYCRPGDSISVAAYQRDADHALCIEVADTGPGIPKSDIEKLFYRFYRGRQRGEGSGVHAGLGLAIAARAAEAMGGRVEMESEPGEGSAFRVVLPWRELEEPTATDG